MRVGLLVTDRPITPSGTGRAAPQIWCARSSGRRRTDCTSAGFKSGRKPRCSRNYRRTTSRRWTLNNIIGGLGHATAVSWLNIRGHLSPAPCGVPHIAIVAQAMKRPEASCTRGSHLSCLRRTSPGGPGDMPGS